MQLALNFDAWRARRTTRHRLRYRVPQQHWRGRGCRGLVKFIANSARDSAQKMPDSSNQVNQDTAS